MGIGCGGAVVGSCCGSSHRVHRHDRLGRAHPVDPRDESGVRSAAHDGEDILCGRRLWKWCQHRHRLRGGAGRRGARLPQHRAWRVGGRGSRRAARLAAWLSEVADPVRHARPGGRGVEAQLPAIAAAPGRFWALTGPTSGATCSRACVAAVAPGSGDGGGRCARADVAPCACHCVVLPARLRRGCVLCGVVRCRVV